MEESISFAKKFLEDVLSFFGLNSDIYATSDEDVIELSVPSTHLNGFLIGHRGETMRALQFIVSNALKNNDFEYTRVNVDIADYKKQRAHRLGEQVEEMIKEVKETGQDLELLPMNAVDRRIVHKVAGEAGYVTESVGEGKDRRVIIKAGATSNAAADAGSTSRPGADDDVQTREAGDADLSADPVSLDT